MRFMIVERYTSGPGPIYERAAARGRMLPEGLRYIDSWVVDDDRMDRCFQLMETDDPALIEVWLRGWQDLGEFDVLPVIGSEEAAHWVGVTWPAAPRREKGQPR